MEDILQELKKAIVEGEDDLALDVVQQALADGVDPFRFTHGFIT